jgi:hypothetical protein
MGHWYIWLPALTGALRVIDDAHALVVALIKEVRPASTRRNPNATRSDLDR